MVKDGRGIKSHMAIFKTNHQTVKRLEQCIFWGPFCPKNSMMGKFTWQETSFDGRKTCGICFPVDFPVGFPLNHWHHRWRPARPWGSTKSPQWPRQQFWLVPIISGLLWMKQYMPICVYHDICHLLDSAHDFYIPCHSKLAISLHG